MERNKENGITLIALVITIVVLLILAGITINLVLGEDGIIKRVKEAKEIYKNAETNEITDLTYFEASIIPGKVAKTLDGIQYVGDGIGNIIPVPVGFKYLEGTKYTGFVVVNETDGNEFVWIPVKGMEYAYDRYAFTRNGWGYSQTKEEYDTITNSYKIIKGGDRTKYFTETISSIEEQSVNQYGGFYIGRYEAGTVSTTARTTTSGISDAMVVQKRKNVYNNITYTDAKTKAESLYTKTDNNIASRLCSCYAWDTTLKFIETNYLDYSTNSIGNNYKDTTFTYTDLDGNVQTKAQNRSKLVPTGQTTSAKNIYDMGGNVIEWVTETYTNTESGKSVSCTTRGGGFDRIAEEAPAGKRDPGWINSAVFESLGFRVSLYL